MLMPKVHDEGEAVAFALPFAKSISCANLALHANAITFCAKLVRVRKTTIYGLFVPFNLAHRSIVRRKIQIDHMNRLFNRISSSERLTDAAYSVCDDAKRQIVDIQK